MPSSSPTEILFRLEVVIEPDDGQYHAYCPALKGLHTCGDTVDEALEHAADAAAAYLASLIKHGEPIPLAVVTDEPATERRPASKGGVTHHTRELSVAIA